LTRAKHGLRFAAIAGMARRSLGVVRRNHHFERNCLVRSSFTAILLRNRPVYAATKIVWA
jgi:hypothetical protein